SKERAKPRAAGWSPPCSRTVSSRTESSSFICARRASRRPTPPRRGRAVDEAAAGGSRAPTRRLRFSRRPAVRQRRAWSVVVLSSREVSRASIGGLSRRPTIQIIDGDGGDGVRRRETENDTIEEQLGCEASGDRVCNPE